MPKGMAKKDSKEEIEEEKRKRHRENQRAYYQRTKGKERNWTVMKTKRILCNAGLLKILKMYSSNKINSSPKKFVYMKRIANALPPKTFYTETAIADTMHRAVRMWLSVANPLRRAD